tara:strand:- start:3512 stop:3760 length:249 start_codon:yes stop_codon:yes gene_type:complete
MKKSIIYKLTDKDEPNTQEALYFTLQGLTIHIVNDTWVEFDNIMPGSNEFTQAEICESHEYLFAYIDSIRYEVQRIVVDKAN